MDSMEKRVRSRFSHRRDIVLELAVEDFDSPDSGPIALLQSLLSLPVSCFPYLESVSDILCKSHQAVHWSAPDGCLWCGQRNTPVSSAPRLGSAGTLPLNLQ